MTLPESLALFGLDTAEQQTLMLLWKHPDSTALALSQLTSIKRTTLYRVLDRLVSRGLVIQKTDDKTTSFSAAQFSQFETLVREEEGRINALKQGLEVIMQSGNELLQEQQVRILVNPKQVASLPASLHAIERRVIDPDILTIPTMLVCAPHGVSTMNTKRGEIETVTLKQLFELAWSLGEPL